MEREPLIVVTGAAGFIGGQLLTALRGMFPPESLLAVDHPAKPGRPLAAHLARSGILFFDHKAFVKEFDSGNIRPSTIFHLGACSSTTETNWDYLQENNLRYSQQLWSLSVRQGVRLFYASSAATYGDGSSGFDDESDLDGLRPLNLYGRSKHEFDLWAVREAAMGHHPIQWAGYKFFNVFGPGEAHKGRMASMVFHGFHQARDTGRIRLFQSHRPEYNHGGQLRDFIYVKDVLRVMFQVAERPDIQGLFNVGTGNARSFNDLALAIFAVLQVPAEIEYIPMPEDLRMAYQYRTEATMGKLGRLGIDVRCQALEHSVRDYLDHHRDSLEPPAAPR